MHFFMYGNMDARSMEVCVLSVARQLCASVPGFRKGFPSTKEEIEKRVKQASAVGIEALLETLIVAPAEGVEAPPKHKVAVLLDALDECHLNDRKQLIQRIEDFYC